MLKTNKARGEFWQNITGGVDDGELFIDAALRESIEETHVKKENLHTIKETPIYFSFVDRWKNKVQEQVFFLQTKKKWNVILDVNEHIDHKWISEDEYNPSNVKYETNDFAIQKLLELSP